MTLVHHTDEKRQGGSSETTVIDVEAGERYLHPPGYVGPVARPEAWYGPQDPASTRTASAQRIPPTWCPNAAAGWSASTPATRSHGSGICPWRTRPRTAGGVTATSMLELVTRDRWSELFGNYSEVSGKRCSRTGPAREPDHRFPTLDVRPDGTRDLGLRRINLKTGEIRALRPLPGSMPMDPGDGSATMCAGRLAYATAQGLFLVAAPASPPIDTPREPVEPPRLPRLDRTVRVDGLLDDWKDVSYAPLGQVTTHPLSAEHSAAKPLVKLAWDDLRLCIAISVPGPEILTVACTCLAVGR